MNKGISYRSSELLNGLVGIRKEFFTLNDACEILSGKDNSTVRKLLSDMTKRGIIMRIKEGLYHVIPFEQHPDNYFPNWHLTAEAIAGAREYYIGFYSALDIHGLITQPSLVEQVVTRKQIKPKVHLIRNVRFEFITMSENRFFGYKKHWIDDFHKVFCSDLEKTFLDCLYRPDYSGGITEITKALYKSRELLQQKKLQQYLCLYDSQAIYKRLGFLLDKLGLFHNLQEHIAAKVTSSYTLLSPLPRKHGHYDSKWGIIENVGFDSIMDSIKT